jgi:lipopolysaccharide export system protein LptC
VTSEEHVDVKLLNGTLTADKLRITGGGEIVRFEGNVVMNLDSLPADGAPNQSANASAPAAEPAQSGKTRSISGKSANSK